MTATLCPESPSSPTPEDAGVAAIAKEANNVANPSPSGIGDTANHETNSHRAIDADTIDAVSDAASTLSGIAEALAYRTAGKRDDMLELLASAAMAQAEALRANSRRAQRQN